MKTDFKFGDKVTHVGHKNTYGVILSTDGYNATVYYSSTDTPRLPLEELKPYVDTSITSITRVMDALGIKKDVPIDVYDKDTDEKDAYSPYTFNGTDFVDNEDDKRRVIIAEIITGDSYFLPHNSFPQLGDVYYYICPNGTIMHRNWDGLSYDYATKLMGNVFESEVEAKCHVTEMLAKYHGVM